MASLYVILTHPPFHLHRCHTHTHTQDRLDLFIIIYDASLYEMPSFFNRQAIRSSHKHFSLVLFVDIVITYLPLWGFRSLFRTKEYCSCQINAEHSEWKKKKWYQQYGRRFILNSARCHMHNKMNHMLVK